MRSVEEQRALERAAVRRIVAAPSTGMIFCGLVTLVILGMFFYLANSNPGSLFDFLENTGLPNVDDSVSSEEREADRLERRKYFVEYAASPYIVPLSITIGGALLAIFAGIATKLLWPRPLCIAAVIISILLFGIPCCLNIIFGLWAIMALNREEVVAVFESTQ